MSGSMLMLLGSALSEAPPSPYWDVENLYYNPPESKRYLLNASSFLPVVGEQNVAISGFSDTNQRGIFLGGTASKPILFMVGTSGDTVESYTRSSLWSVAGELDENYDVKTFSVSGQTATPWGIFLKPDGTKMWIGDVTNTRILQYSLSTAWDITSASFEKSVSLSPTVVSLAGFSFNSIGSLIVVADSNTDRVYRFENPTFWDVQDTYYADDFLSVSGQDTAPSGVAISADGIHLYLIGTSADRISHYEMSFGNTLSTASFVGNYTLAADPYGLWMDPAGRYFGYLRASSASFNYIVALGSYNLSTLDTTPRGIYLSPDGGRLYVTGNAGDTIEQFSMSPAYDLGSISHVRSQSVSAADAEPRGVFFKPDGTKMFFCGNSGDTVEVYDLNTAWDISTLTGNAQLSVSSRLSTVNNLFFSPDGTRLFICGIRSGFTGVVSYTLSTAWDIASATFTSELSTSPFPGGSSISPPNGITFSSDGKTLHVVGSYVAANTNNGIIQVTLGTAWDITTPLTYKKSGLGDIANTVTAMAWENNGTGLWLTGTGGGTSNIYKFTIDAS